MVRSLGVSDYICYWVPSFPFYGAFFIFLTREMGKSRSRFGEIAHSCLTGDFTPAICRNNVENIGNRKKESCWSRVLAVALRY